MNKLQLFLVVLLSLSLICGIEGCAQENVGEINETTTINEEVYSFNATEDTETQRILEESVIQENVSEENFEGEPPYPVGDLMRLLTPDEVKDYLQKIDFENDTSFKDLKIMHEWLYHWMVYHYDMAGLQSSEIWTSPKDALERRSGDCEEWATTFLSLAKAYDRNVKCSNVILPGHLTTVCKTVDPQSASWAKIMERYTFFDLKGFMRTTEIEASLSQPVKEDEMYKFLTFYFSEYGIVGEDREILAVFDDKTYEIFDSNGEFISWILEI